MVARDLLIAIGIPLALLLLALLALERNQGRLPCQLRRLSEKPSRLWSIGVGLIIGLSLLRWLLQR